MNRLTTERSNQHAKLLNTYVQAVERHKTLLPGRRGTVATALSPDQLHELWLADAQVELTRQALEAFRSSQGLPQ